ncbi:MAG: hypothetical protein K0S08_223 [Gammaproteobacteria bacterium]|jgi:hypothetical protein|nr:hypothetical protein [Gammaproteobacteria bacterium]
MRSPWAYLSVLFFLTAQAEIYQSYESNGGLHFADTYSKGSQIFAPSPERINILPSVNNIAPSTNLDKSQTLANITLSISRPKDGTSINNQDIIPVSIRLQPGLSEGNQLQLLLDSKSIGIPQKSLEFILPANLARGTHQLQAQLIDANNHVLRSSQVVTFYAHQNSQLYKQEA